MALLTKISSITSGTGGVGTTRVQTGVGFQPKALIFFWNGDSSTGVNANGRSHHRRGVGFAVSPTDRRCVASQSGDALSAAEADHVYFNDACVASLINTSGDVDGALDLQSMDADGFTLVTDNNFATSFRLNIMNLGGDSLTNAATGQITEPGSTGNQVISSLSFKPDCLIFIGADDEGIASGTKDRDSKIMMGFAENFNGTVHQGVCGVGSDDTADPTGTHQYNKKSQCIITLDSGFSSIGRATLVSTASNGFTINWSTVTGNPNIIHYLALKGGKYFVGNLSTRQDGNDIVTGGYGFKPNGAILLSTMNTETSGPPTANDRWCTGFFSARGNTVDEKRCFAVRDQSAVGTTEVSTAIQFDNVYVNLNADGTIAAVMDIKSIDKNGVTYYMTDADIANNNVVFLAFGDSPPMSGLMLR